MSAMEKFGISDFFLVFIESTEQRISNSFAIFATFLEALTNPRDDGKVIVMIKGIRIFIKSSYFIFIIKFFVETLGQCSIKYFALKTSSFFNEIVNEARSIIVAGNFIRISFLTNMILFFLFLGGTMRPVVDEKCLYSIYLFLFLDK